MRKIIFFFFLLAALPLACAKDSARDSNLTPGMVKKYIYPGRTTQTEVLEIFGPPNLVTSKNGKEVWTYDRFSHEVTASSGFLTILVAGYQKEKHRSSSRSVLLLLYFDNKERVADYKLHAAKF